MPTDDLRWLDATATAALIRSGEVSAREVNEAAMARIDAGNDELNAVIHRQYERALGEVDERAASGPFAGVPFLLKDAVAHFAGDPEHFGMRVLKEAGHSASTTSWLAARFQTAGLVTLGRTNVPEMATTITTEPLAYGPARNPWNTGHSTGGSSGGAAAAVASGMVPVAHGNDMGGSIRVPASHCGLVGLKPSRARGTLGPDLGELWGPLTHEHVLTRSVRDTAAVLDAISGPGVGDPYTAPAFARPLADEVGVDPGSLRIAWRTSGPTGESHPEVVSAVHNAVGLLASLGHHVEEDAVTPLDASAIGDGVAVIFGAVVAREVDRWSERLGREIQLDELEPLNALFAEMGRAVTGAQWLAGVETLQAWSRTMEGWFTPADDTGRPGAAAFDVLVVPVMPEPPPALGDLTVEGQGDAFSVLIRLSGLTTFTMPFNISGQPAISLPLHWTADGLPVGVQFVAPYGREDVLIRLASQLEAAQPWADRHPG